jgi:hypothetical protein
MISETVPEALETTRQNRVRRRLFPGGREPDSNLWSRCNECRVRIAEGHSELPVDCLAELICQIRAGESGNWFGSAPNEAKALATALAIRPPIGMIAPSPAPLKPVPTPVGRPFSMPIRGPNCLPFDRQLVESECGAVAVGRTYLLPPLSSGGASLVRPWLRFHTHRVTGGGRPPPVPTERGVRISRTNALRKLVHSTASACSSR